MPVIWMRFARDGVSLFLLGAFSLGIVYALQRFEPELARTVVWRRKPWAQSVGLGLATGALIGAPAVAMGFFVPSWARGGSVALSFLPMVAWLSFAGNLLEELLFRGYLQPIFERDLGAARAVWASGLAFAAAHGVLAAHLGGSATLILVAFTLYEGTLCALLRRRDGVVASALAHGLGLFLVSSGLP
jgi:membrane protease YdiL (CAAX protease family)